MITINERLNPPDVPACRWDEDDDGNWSSSCQKFFIFEYDGPTENGFEFCPYCGKKLLPVAHDPRS